MCFNLFYLNYLSNSSFFLALIKFKPFVLDLSIVCQQLTLVFSKYNIKMTDKVSKKDCLTEIQKAEILKDNVKKITKHQKLYTKYFWNKYNTS